MLKLPPASTHVKRHLTPRELVTIASALEMLASQPASGDLDEFRTLHSGSGEWISDDEMRALAYELTRARKVKVCRTKLKQS